MTEQVQSDLDLRILARLYRQLTGGAWTCWVRFLAKDEAARLGGGAADAEEALRRLHNHRYLAPVFGFERGRLTRRGLWAAERLARRHPAHGAMAAAR